MTEEDREHSLEEFKSILKEKKKEKNIFLMICMLLE